MVGQGTLPPAVVFDENTPSPDPTAPSCSIALECFESMRVDIGFGTVVGPNQRFGTDPIAEVLAVARAGRTFREKGIDFPGLVGLPVFDGNPEIFEIDIDRLGLPSVFVNAGSTFTASGVLGFEFGDYDFFPSSFTLIDEVVLPVPVRAPRRSELTIGSLNVQRLFDDIADGGETVLPTEVFERRLGKLSGYIREVLRSPDVLGIQEVESLKVLEDLALQIAIDDPSVTYAAFLVEGSDPSGIDVGYLVRPAVTVDAVTQLGADEIFIPFGFPLHDRPPFLLEGRVRCDEDDDDDDEIFRFAVMVNHTRSRSGIEDPDIQQKRLEQAQSIAEKVQAFQTVNPRIPLVLIGDLNSFEFTDGFVDVVGQIRGVVDPAENLLSGPDLVDPDLVLEVAAIEPAERYSFIFDGSAQVLDHALTSLSASRFIRGVEYGRGNADAPRELENDGSTLLRASDHDGFVVFLKPNCDDDDEDDEGDDDDEDDEGDDDDDDD